MEPEIIIVLISTVMLVILILCSEYIDWNKKQEEKDIENDAWNWPKKV